MRIVGVTRSERFYTAKTQDMPGYPTVYVKLLSDKVRADLSYLAESAARLEAEASLMARLWHPNIMRVYALVVDSSVVVVGLVMEHFGSGQLSRLLQQQVCLWVCLYILPHESFACSFVVTLSGCCLPLVSLLAGTRVMCSALAPSSGASCTPARPPTLTPPGWPGAQQ
jgi:hypothetical protein